jgi:acetylornithine deacetylase/succinyl-diaminopimelate desuccinylase-like protein
MSLAKDLDSFFASNQSRARDELFDLLRIPSVSARSDHNADTARAADWIAASLRRIGLTTTVHPTKGHPIVVGEWRKAPSGAQTVLIYGHYDVQPAEPLELWDSPPFEPTIRDGKIFARSSTSTSKRSRHTSRRVARCP